MENDNRQPLLEGGQGRYDEDVSASGIEFALFAIVGFLLLGVFFLAAVLIKAFC